MKWNVSIRGWLPSIGMDQNFLGYRLLIVTYYRLPHSVTKLGYHRLPCLVTKLGDQLPPVAIICNQPGYWLPLATKNYNLIANQWSVF